jgi:hypothetical protein
MSLPDSRESEKHFGVPDKVSKALSCKGLCSAPHLVVRQTASFIINTCDFTISSECWHGIKTHLYRISGKARR